MSIVTISPAILFTASTGASASLQTPFGSSTLIDFLGAIKGRMSRVHKCERARGEESQSFGDVQHPQDVHENWACGV